MKEKLEWDEKLHAYRTSTLVIALVIVFALTMLATTIPLKTSAIWAMIGTVGVFSLYLIVLCLRLIKELKDRVGK